jgi:hypothetical protein
MFGEDIEMKLIEKNKRVPDGSWSRKVPTGILYFSGRPNYNEKIWSDGKLKLEDQLSHIIAYLEVKALARAEEARLWRIKQEEKEERDRIQKELEERQELELENFKLLLKKTKRWQQLRLIRGYIDELESKSMQMNLFTEEIKEWVQWARAKADWYDPHINAKDELLDDVDTETLTFTRKRSSYWH